MSTRVRMGLGLVVCAGLLVTACRKDPTPTPVPPTPTQAAGPTLTILRDVVSYRERETDPLEELEEGDSMDVAPGANIVVGNSGRATLDWPMFLRHELVARADTLLSLSEPNARHAILDQAAGTGRYTVEGSGEPTDLQVNAGFLSLGQSVAVIEVSAGPADFIVSIDDSDTPVVWIAMLDGTAEVMRGKDAVTLEAGDVATFTQEGDLPAGFELDAKLISRWYDDLADGSAEEPISSVAFFCRVTGAAAPLLAAPLSTAAAAGGPLAEGLIVKVLGRNAESTFLRVEVDTAEGWLDAENVTCIAAIPAAPLVIEGGTATPTLLPTRLPPTLGTPTASPTLGTATVTPTPTGTGEAYTFNFGASPGTIDEGECSTLSWEVYGVEAVYLDGGGVAGGSQSKKVCPDDTTTYTMEVVKRDGTKESKSATVKVQPKAATTAPEPTTTTPPTLPPDPTEQPTPETTAAPPGVWGR